MKRETTNRIRYVLEEVLPPFIRDSAPMRWLFRRYWGPLIDDLESFRANIHHITEAQYDDIYARMPRIQDETDNSTACLERISADLVGESILDVGCGTGFLARLAQQHTDAKITGVDIYIGQNTRDQTPGVTLKEARIERLPFNDGAFDTVICTHVLEHILDIRIAIAELRRVCSRRLIIVVPREREHRFTFNPHIQFFAYEHSFLRQMIPVPTEHVCDRIGRDIYYREDNRGNVE
jgi:ubiquinone/menaquinone biosynthesis C-methylase UbiE